LKATESVAATFITDLAPLALPLLNPLAAIIIFPAILLLPILVPPSPAGSLCSSSRKSEKNRSDGRKKEKIPGNFCYPMLNFCYSIFSKFGSLDPATPDWDCEAAKWIRSIAFRDSRGGLFYLSLMKP
jgi:hypothetical protein